MSAAFVPGRILLEAASFDSGSGASLLTSSGVVNAGDCGPVKSSIGGGGLGNRDGDRGGDIGYSAMLPRNDATLFDFLAVSDVICLNITSSLR